jgi:5-oxoprolinase (ATP-hydrolysing)
VQKVCKNLSQNKSTKIDTYKNKWQFWIDRGGTFTDIVARRPDGSLTTHKLLSENPERYKDAATQGIRDLLAIETGEPIPAHQVAAVKMGTTVGTNALLERKGERTLLAITEGFHDQLRIAYQNRPKLFDLNIQLPELLYSDVVEVPERLAADGSLVRPLDEATTRKGLQAAFDKGYRAVAIVLIHAYRHTGHEARVAEIAREIGFTQVSASHEVSPLIKMVSRGDTTVVDAYLSPILRRYVDQVASDLGDVTLQFMQSNGGLTAAERFQGKDCIVSGPAGGVVGAARAAEMAGFDRIIGFDMGGTSTDVSHYAGEYERAFETQVAGVRMRAPMMQIHTVAAGGGSMLFFDGSRYRVGPESAGANPGPASYRRGGPLTVTDANVMLGRLQGDFFPKVFGPEGNEALDPYTVTAQFTALAVHIKDATGNTRSPEQVAEGFLTIAIDNMANAIREISVRRGYDVTRYTLCAFGGAGGQHVCRIADALGMASIFLHPFAGVLSAYGMGLADLRVVREQSVEARLEPDALADFEATLATLADAGHQEMAAQGLPHAQVRTEYRLHLRYDGTDSSIEIPFAADVATMRDAFEAAHKQRFGFVMPDKALVAATAVAEVIGETEVPDEPKFALAPSDAKPLARRPVWAGGKWQNVPFYDRDALTPGTIVQGPAVILETTGTTVLEPGWQARLTERLHLVLDRTEVLQRDKAIGTEADPVRLELFNNLYMSIAEQMGAALENTAYSVNIKERLDFSCAIFDPDGFLCANAPHMPVHLGSMGQAVRSIIRTRRGTMKAGDFFAQNAPYNGGTHLPDITVIAPVFEAGEVIFYVASRGHHADIGGKTPGSMPPDSVHIEEEGVLIDDFLMVDGGTFLEQEISELLASGRYPTRNVAQNIADLRAQIAACERGIQEVRGMVEQFGLDAVQAYMGHVQDNAEEQVRRVIGRLHDGAFRYELDDGSHVQVAISVDREARSAKIDFTGTATQQHSNFNAPSAVARAAALYVFRCLLADDIPLNDGVLKPLEIIIPEGCMLNPQYPAAVVAGNVETSQVVTDTLFGALGVMGASQGTMNNFTFGNDTYQYYETICGGSGAGPGFDGTSAVHTHMTNTRLTDPEILEWRFPVRLESFSIRHGSGGAGEFRGGNGIIRRVRFLEPMTAAILSNHRRIAPYGMAGGEPGQVGETYVLRAETGERIDLGGQGQAEMAVGDVFVIETPGGGGYGAA